MDLGLDIVLNLRPLISNCLPKEVLVLLSMRYRLDTTIEGGPKPPIVVQSGYNHAVRRLLLLILGLALGAFAAEPCLQPDKTCTEHFPVGSGFVVLYRNYAVASANSVVDRAVIMVHGAQRNGDGYYATALAAAAASGNLMHTLVIAPAFRGREGRGCTDAVEPGELFWSCQGWNAGFAALGPGKMPNSFEVVDRILTLLSDRTRYPRLQSIVVAGHSGGGQFVQRYAALNRIEESVKVPVRYVVANPSSYVYLDEKRPPTGANCTAEGACSAPAGAYSDQANCTGYNRYRYGLDALSGYAAEVGAETIRKQFPLRNVTYLIGDLDVLPDTDLDKSCPANAQGVNRRERGLNYWNYVRTGFKADHKLVMVPRCGHNAACMFASSTGTRALFPTESK
jgi:pimeloyl-ACP methyl ester carboxylesterase